MGIISMTGKFKNIQNIPNIPNIPIKVLQPFTSWNPKIDYYTQKQLPENFRKKSAKWFPVKLKIEKLKVDR